MLPFSGKHLDSASELGNQVCVEEPNPHQSNISPQRSIFSNNPEFNSVIKYHNIVTE